ncbi:MAG: hypothetical protein M3Y70_08900 [Pseudomonadota bacterium]|nr:hypothetical protein [Pseudomonadota bacterium]
MMAWPRSVILPCAALAIGGLAFLLLGPGPGPQSASGLAHVDWQLPDPPARELDAPDKVWTGRAPWGGGAARPGADAEPPPPPPLVPVGVVASGQGFRAVFIAAGGPEVRVKAGDTLPDGGQVTAVSRFHVSWIDGQGTKHEQELLADPLPRQNKSP